MSVDTHTRFMRRAVQIAAYGEGATGSNPTVGAVLVHEGKIIAEGWHAVYGGPHAEVACLDSVAPADRALVPYSTLYVTLEPCAHHGKTPPCADRIVSEGIRTVVVAQRDPFARVDGRGLEKLLAAGVDVITGVCGAEARWSARRFLCAHELHRPYIILKWAQSADGFIAPADRTRTQLSGPLSQRMVHRWREQEAAILVGYRTALHDDPSLTARFGGSRQPLRVLLDDHLSIPPDAALFSPGADTLVVHKDGAPGEAASNIRYLRVPGSSHLPAVLDELYRLGRYSLIVEGGAAVLESFVRAGLWDEARVFATPVILHDGVRAPDLSGAGLRETFDLGPDELRIFISSQNAFAG